MRTLRQREAKGINHLGTRPASSVEGSSLKRREVVEVRNMDPQERKDMRRTE